MVGDENPEDSPYYFHEGFEANVFDPLHWKWMEGDAAWDIEGGVAENPATKGRRYAEARTENIVVEFGTSILQLTVESRDGGMLLYQIQALIRVPFEDVVVEVDGVATDIIMIKIAEWETRELEIEGGHHVVRWVHRKNPMDASEGEMAASAPNEGITRIDDVTFLPR